MIDLIFNLIIPLNISIEFENNIPACGLTITVTKCGFRVSRSINKYELERMDDTCLYNVIKNMVSQLLYEEQRRIDAVRKITESNITIKIERKVNRND